MCRNESTKLTLATNASVAQDAHSAPDCIGGFHTRRLRPLLPPLQLVQFDVVVVVDQIHHDDPVANALATLGRNS